MQTKSFVYSKTFWLATIQALIAIIAIFATAYPQVGELLLIKSILDVLLRVGTDTKLSL